MLVALGSDLRYPYSFRLAFFFRADIDPIHQALCYQFLLELWNVRRTLHLHTLHWLHLGACGCRGKRAPIPAWNVKRSIIIAAAWFAGVAETSSKPVTKNFRVP